MSDPVGRAYDRLLNGILWFMIAVAAIPTVVGIVVVIAQAAR